MFGCRDAAPFVTWFRLRLSSGFHSGARAAPVRQGSGAFLRQLPVHSPETPAPQRPGPASHGCVCPTGSTQEGPPCQGGDGLKRLSRTIAALQHSVIKGNTRKRVLCLILKHMLSDLDPAVALSVDGMFCCVRRRVPAEQVVWSCVLQVERGGQQVAARRALMMIR